MIRFNPAGWSIRWQIAALLIVTQIVAHVISVVTISTFSTRRGGEAELVVNLSEPFLTALRLTAGDPAEAAPHLAALPGMDDRFAVTDRLPSVPTDAAGWDDSAVHRAVFAELPARWRDHVMFYAADDGAVTYRNFRLALRLPQGHWLVYGPRGDTLVEAVPQLVGLLGLLFFALPLMLLAVWSGLVLTRPITALAAGAEAFARDTATPPLREDGPVEVRKAKRAFNQMRIRIRKLLSDRSQTLASIGHDMRTPLTRLRLRLEMLEPGPATEKINEDVTTLERMIDDALEFLRSENQPVVLTQVDLAVLVRTVADDYADRGHGVVYQGPARLVFRCDVDLVRRILDNVVGNAAKYAKAAEVTLQAGTSGAVRIAVRDNGPGIPPDHREKVLEPFARIAAVRAGTAQTAPGFGLGLAIARDLTERLGGRLTLGDNVPSGLLVTICLPLRLADGAATAVTGGTPHV